MSDPNGQMRGITPQGPATPALNTYRPPNKPVADPNLDALQAAYGPDFKPGGGDFNAGLATQHIGDPNSDAYLADVANQKNIATGGWNAVHDVSKYWLGGQQNYANDQNARQQFASDVFAGRGNAYAAGVNPMMQGLGQQAGAVAGYGNQLGALAGQRGEGQGLVGQAGQGLLALGQMPSGPSAAELAMRANAGQATANQAAMAAGVRGGNAGLALQAAGANQAQISGQLGQQLGVQRAQEDMANRTFAANALGQAAGVFGGQNAAQASMYGQAGALNQGAGSLYGQGAQTYGSLAQGAEQASIGRASLGYGLQGQQLGANQAYDTGKVDANLRQYGIRKGTKDTGDGTITGSAGGDKAIGIGATALSSLAMLSDLRAKKDIAPAAKDVADAYRSMSDDPMVADTGSAYVKRWNGSGWSQPYLRGSQPSGPPPVLASAHNLSPRELAMLGDPRAANPGPEPMLTRAQPAPPAPSQPVQDPRYGFRYENAFPDAPAYAYDYRNPSAPGAAPGRHYGPMAQDLEQTPAGASVVGTDQKGRKFVDPGRLAMLNTGEISNHRKQLDSLSAKLDAALGYSIGSLAEPTTYPTGYDQ